MVITLTGSNSFLLSQALKGLTDDFVKSNGDLALERYEGDEVELPKLREAIQALPFLAAKKMVVVRNLSSNKPAGEQIADIVTDVPESTDLVLVEPKPDKRSTVYKTLKSKTAFREFHELDERQLAAWAVQLAKELKGQLGLVDANYLVQRVGANQTLLAHELEKLVGYDPKITRASIDLLTEELPQSKIFDLLDAALSGNKQRTIELYADQRRQRVEPQAVMAMLAWQLHVLAVVKAGERRDPGSIASDSRLNPYVVRKTQQLVSSRTMKDIKSLIARALDLDVKMKSININADDALQHLLLSLR